MVELFETILKTHKNQVLHLHNSSEYVLTVDLGDCEVIPYIVNILN
jgi:hypothetical protein